MHVCTYLRMYASLLNMHAFTALLHDFTFRASESCLLLYVREACIPIQVDFISCLYAYREQFVVVRLRGIYISIHMCIHIYIYICVYTHLVS